MLRNIVLKDQEADLIAAHLDNICRGGVSIAGAKSVVSVLAILEKANKESLLKEQPDVLKREPRRAD